MNTIYALMLVTATGIVEAPNNFSSLAECEKVSQRVQNTYCAEKKPVDVEFESKKFMNMFKNIVKEMDKS